MSNSDLEKEALDVDPYDQAAVRRHLLNIEREFNRVRERLYYKVQSYFHQSLFSSYTKEDDIRVLLKECEDLKNQYKSFKSFVAGIRGTDHIL